MDTSVIAELSRRLRAGTLVAEDLNVLERGFDVAGLAYDEVTADVLRAHLDADERHHQPFGLVHGGVWCTVVETIASIAASLRVAADGRLAVGVANATDIVRSHRTGRVDIVAEPLHVGHSQQLWEVRMTRGSDDALIARGQLRVHNLDVAPAAGGEAAGT